MEFEDEFFLAGDFDGTEEVLFEACFFVAELMLFEALEIGSELKLIEADDDAPCETNEELL